MPEYSIEYADVYFVYGEYSRKANAMLLSAGMLMLVSCVPQKTHSQQAMTKVKYVLVPDVK
jgi:hypothetical protein